jgi:hypothetical protein
MRSRRLPLLFGEIALFLQLDNFGIAIANVTSKWRDKDRLAKCASGEYAYPDA